MRRELNGPGCVPEPGEAFTPLVPLWHKLLPAEEPRTVHLPVEAVDVKRHGVERLRPNGLPARARGSRKQEGSGVKRTMVSADGEMITVHIPCSGNAAGGSGWWRKGDWIFSDEATVLCQGRWRGMHGMSIKVTSCVWEHGPSDRLERLMLLALADFCDDQGRCWPAMARLADRACVTERGARKIIRRLEAGGWLTTKVGGGRHGCNEYHVTPKPKPRSAANPEPEPPLDQGNPELGSTLNPEHLFPRNEVSPEPESTKPGTGVEETRNPSSAEPSRTIIEP